MAMTRCLLDTAAATCSCPLCGCHQQQQQRAGPTPAAARPAAPRRRHYPSFTGMAPLLLWTAVVAALASLGSVGVSAMPMLTDQGQRAEPYVPTAILEWYLQQRDLQQRDMQQREADLDQPPVQQLQPSEIQQQFREWLTTQLARLPAPVEQGEEANKALVGPPQPKRGNYMALCHFKICNMGRKRSGRLQSQDLP